LKIAPDFPSNWHKRLSADVISFSAAQSSVKREKHSDTVNNILSMKVDMVVMLILAALTCQKCKASIINAGDGAHEHTGVIRHSIREN
jgi:aspartate carbamoyltransferase catalytic subunit